MSALCSGSREWLRLLEHVDDLFGHAVHDENLILYFNVFVVSQFRNLRQNLGRQRVTIYAFGKLRTHGGGEVFSGLGGLLAELDLGMLPSLFSILFGRRP